jgi:hypothetical protein
MKPIHKILLANLLVSLGIGIVAFFGIQLMPKNGDTAAILMGISLIVIAVQALVCWIASLVYFLKKNNAYGLGLLLSGFLVGLVGFGTCSALLMSL